MKNRSDAISRVLAGYAVPSDALARTDSDAVVCLACAHRCRIPDGGSGVCRMRLNRGGRLFVPHGYIAGIQADPVEKKPFYHVLPGQAALSYGLLGCNFRCAFCQNWVSSQTLKDDNAGAPTTADRKSVV